MNNILKLAAAVDKLKEENPEGGFKVVDFVVNGENTALATIEYGKKTVKRTFTFDENNAIIEGAEKC